MWWTRSSTLPLPLKLKASWNSPVPTASTPENAISAIESTFAESTIADLLSEQTTSKPLCDELVLIEN